jgi:hypothetical protein
MTKPLSFKQFVSTDYTDTGDEQLAKSSKDRKVQDEALDMQQRRKKAIAMKRNKAKIAMGRRRAERKVANLDKLKKRARRHARNMLAKKLTKDIPKADLSNARKKEIEKRLEKPAMQQKINRSARKLLPQVRKSELQKKRGGGKKDD